MNGGKHIEDEVEEEPVAGAKDPQDWTTEDDLPTDAGKSPGDKEDWTPEDVCAPEYYNTD